MKRQSTSSVRCDATSSTQREVIHAHGHTGSQKKSTSLMAPIIAQVAARGAPPLDRGGGPARREGCVLGRLQLLLDDGEPAVPEPRVVQVAADDAAQLL